MEYICFKIAPYKIFDYDKKFRFLFDFFGCFEINFKYVRQIRDGAQILDSAQSIVLGIVLKGMVKVMYSLAAING